MISAKATQCNAKCYNLNNSLQAIHTGNSAIKDMTVKKVVQFSALGKAHMRFTPPLRSFPNVAFETVPMFNM